MALNTGTTGIARGTRHPKGLGLEKKDYCSKVKQYTVMVNAPMATQNLFC